MNKDIMLDYYRNHYQLICKECEKLKEQLETYKLISTLKEDLLNHQEELIRTLNRRIELNDRNNNDRES